jgi:D-alanyl-D-alanine carboxypeptidase
MSVFDPASMLAPLQARGDALHDARDAPAVLVAAYRDGRYAATASGVDDLGTGVAARPGQSFEVGSQTKMMTAVVILQLAAEGLIDLDAPASDYLPESVTEGIANARVATIREMLAMRSGVPNYTEAVDENGVPLYRAALRADPDTAFGPQEALDVARDMPPTNAPGAAHHYGNTPYLLLGLLIEAVTGNDWADEIETRIFEPAGMRNSTARRFEPDPLRLSSYEDRGGAKVDVTDARWVTRGEAGVVSTTADMIAFLKALLVDRTLLPPAKLAAMTDFAPTGGGFAFGLGLWRVSTGDGRAVIGFAGGTLGTSSATWYDPDSGTFVSMAASLDSASTNAPARGFGADLDALAAWSRIREDEPLTVRSVSAAAIAVADTPGGLRLAAGEASLTLDQSLRATTTANTAFDDGSVLVVGDDAAGEAGDDADNVVRIARDFAAALDRDNRIIGLGGNDDLTGGHGGDRVAGGEGGDRLSGLDGHDALFGGAGADRLAGGRGSDALTGGPDADWIAGGEGDDTLRGGPGADVVTGGPGRDALRGGAGRDLFRFREADSAPGAADAIHDFERDRDTIDLRAIDAVAGGRDSDFDWIGRSRFSDTAGELRIAGRHGDLWIRGDTDGDGHADLRIVLDGLDGLAPDHLLL